MKFKNTRIMREFDLIVPRLQAVLFVADYYSKLNFKKEIVITHLIRYMYEQQSIYKNEIEKGLYIVKNGVKLYASEHDKKLDRPTYSVHQFGRGADLRYWIFTHEEAENLCNYINTYFPYTENKKSCIIHDVGKGVHFHIQVPYCYCDKNLDFSEYLVLKIPEKSKNGGKNG